MNIENLKENLLKILDSMKSSIKGNTADPKTSDAVLAELNMITEEINKDNPDAETVSSCVFQVEELIRDFDIHILPYREFRTPPYLKVRDLRIVIANNMPELL